MTLKDKEDVSNFVKEHFNDSFDLAHESRMVMYRFLSEVEKIMDEQKINKKELASKIGTSSSFITQLFRGNKLLNLVTIAKIQDALNFKFKIEAVSDYEWSVPKIDEEFLKCTKLLYTIDKSSFWVSENKKDSSYTKIKEDFDWIIRRGSSPSRSGNVYINAKVGASSKKNRIPAFKIA